MDSGGLCVMISGTQETHTSHADSLDILVLSLLTMPQVAMQGEWFFSSVHVLVGRLRFCMSIVQLSDKQLCRVRLCTTS